MIPHVARFCVGNDHRGLVPACMILKDINFEVNDNTIMTILGPNGAGKTTLLKCVMGFFEMESRGDLDGWKIHFNMQR